MNVIVDLSDLREMTEGDKELERELFEEFIRCGDEAIRELHDACINEEVTKWHQQAHAFKGVAYNLGAMPLGDLCMRGQESDEAHIKDKARLLDEIIKEYEQVKEYLLKQVA